jgi:hypothetical protein
MIAWLVRLGIAAKPGAPVVLSLIACRENIARWERLLGMIFHAPQEHSQMLPVYNQATNALNALAATTVLEVSLLCLAVVLPATTARRVRSVRLHIHVLPALTPA